MGDTTRKRVAVIGSGFGGAITACRLAESGRFDVHLLERGAEYLRGQFPRRPDAMSDAIWDPARGHFGFLEYRSFTGSHIDVLTGAGLGGGSLIYSNVLFRMPTAHFDDWPGGLTRDRLDPYYARALAMLEASPYPVDRDDWPYWKGTPKSRALAEVAAKIEADREGHPNVTLQWPPLAIQFGKEPGVSLVNAQGIAQATCTMCGECNVGCNAGAKNTLDLNYIARAKKHGARVRTRVEVRGIEARNGSFRLFLCAPGGSGDDVRVETFDKVVLAAGSLGSTELVLRMKDTHDLSPKVGTRFSANGDVLGFVVGTDYPLEPSIGPVITGAFRVRSPAYSDGHAGGEWIEDGGTPGLLAWTMLGRVGGARGKIEAAAGLVDYLTRKLGKPRRSANVGDDVGAVLFASRGFSEHTLLMLGMGRDRSTGTFRLLGKRGPLQLDWSPGEGEVHYQRVRETMERVAMALGGEFVENPLDDVLSRYVSVHPLGGLPLGDDRDRGAVDAKTAELFGVPGLHVIDGSILPSAIGPNPSLTIAALAEMYAERMCRAADV